MRLTIFNIVGLLMAVALLFSQGSVKKQQQYGFTGELGPVLVPTVAASLCIAQNGDVCTTTKTFWLTKITLTEQSGVADTCYLQDKQGTPVGLLGLAAAPMTFPASSTTMLVSPGEKMVNGATWACTNGTVSARVEYGY